MCRGERVIHCHQQANAGHWQAGIPYGYRSESDLWNHSKNQRWSGNVLKVPKCGHLLFCGSMSWFPNRKFLSLPAKAVTVPRLANIFNPLAHTLSLKAFHCVPEEHGDVLSIGRTLALGLALLLGDVLCHVARIHLVPRNFPANRLVHDFLKLLILFIWDTTAAGDGARNPSLRLGALKIAAHSGRRRDAAGIAVQDPGELRLCRVKLTDHVNHWTPGVLVTSQRRNHGTPDQGGQIRPTVILGLKAVGDSLTSGWVSAVAGDWNTRRCHGFVKYGEDVGCVFDTAASVRERDREAPAFKPVSSKFNSAAATDTVLVEQ